MIKRVIMKNKVFHRTFSSERKRGDVPLLSILTLRTSLSDNYYYVIQLHVKLILHTKLLDDNSRLRLEMYENMCRTSNLNPITTLHLFSLRTFSALLISVKAPIS